MPPRNEVPFSVQVPPASEDRPAWVKVGVIAVVGFAIGVAWPRLAGVKLGPNAPGESAPASSAPARVVDAPTNVPVSIGSAPASAQAPMASAPPPIPAAPSGPPSIVVARGAVISCKTEDGEALKGVSACGAVSGFDSFAQPRIRRLSGCSAADGATGKLSATFYVDFTSNRVSVDIGKSSTVPNVESIGACLKQQFAGLTTLGAVEHTHPRYTVFYSASFIIKDGAANPATANAAGANTPATGTAITADAPGAAVVWEVAIVRDTPRTGQVVARLQRGTKIRLGNTQEGWYRVRYGNGFTSEGWVYRGAIGK